MKTQRNKKVLTLSSFPKGFQELKKAVQHGLIAENYDVTQPSNLCLIVTITTQQAQQAAGCI